MLAEEQETEGVARGLEGEDAPLIPPAANDASRAGNSRAASSSAPAGEASIL